MTPTEAIGTRLALGWAMIIVGYLGMTVMFWIYVNWLWYELARVKRPFWPWFVGLYM